MKRPYPIILVAVLLIAACTDRGPTNPTAPEAPVLARATCELLEDPDELLEELLQEVDAREGAALNSGQSRALRNHVENARRQIEQGNHCPARAQLRAFRTQVENFVDAGALTSEQGELLIHLASVLLGDAPPPPDEEPEPPTLVFALVSAGETHTCGVTTSGRAYCWGNGAHGRLGNGATDNQLEPAAVSGNLTFASISAAQNHTCGITTEGDAYCWGSGASGRLGNASTSDSWVPVAVSGTLTFASISAGYQHTCGVTPDHLGYCWGAGSFGQLGNNTFSDSSTPVAVSGGLQFASISAGSPHTCGVTTSNLGYCWGNGSLGQLGNGAATAFQGQPGPVAGNLSFAYISAAQFFTCSVTTGGAAFCWGENEHGRLGNGSLESGAVELEPTAVLGNLSFASISTGGRHAAALITTGEAYAWGNGWPGQLGIGLTTEDKAEPVAVLGGLTFVSISAGGSHTCGLATDAKVYCWGWGFHGQLGNGSQSNQFTPAPAARQ
jgi:alpha-tubulin suppressor-like RCC1 family protein